MHTRPRHAIYLVSAVGLATGLVAIPTSAGARPAAGTHCRHQTFTWTRGTKPALNSAKGPRVRTSASGSVALTDNLATAGFQTAGQVPTKYVSVTGNTVQTGQELTHLRTVTVVQMKGKKQTYPVGPGTGASGFVHSRDITKNYEQVLLPVNGKNSEGLKVPKLKRVTVTAIENCYASDS